MISSLLFGQTTIIVRRPICPTFVHDDTTRIIILLICIPILLLAHYFIFRYFAKNH